MEGRISHFFPRKVDFIQNFYLKIDFELIGHEISLNHKLIKTLFCLPNQPTGILPFFLVRFSFFLLLFCRDNYFLNCWEHFSCYLKISTVVSTYKSSTHQLLADSVSQEAIHHYTRYSTFKGKILGFFFPGRGYVRAEEKRGNTALRTAPRTGPPEWSRLVHHSSFPQKNSSSRY